MPALSDDMYCSEQISIPPSFPYLLRQYAKAAIRTQPTDLLKWSTAYFRCLSLNIPPPVKPRLEYPIPRDFHGITPGWLKALLYQLQNNLTIPFKILWDRWVGACLQHNTLIQILCLGGFDDPQAIPWLRFVALCAATLTDDLTHTMILICEILTEEPEGGSAMIPLETFVDLYKFLAKIDASRDQMLKNFWFRDSLLTLWREKVEKEEEVVEVHEEVLVETEQSVASKTSSESLAKEDVSAEADKVVSCPSLPEDDQYSLDYLKEAAGEEELEIEGAEEEENEHVEEAKTEGEEQSEKAEGAEEAEEVHEEENAEETKEESADKKDTEIEEITKESLDEFAAQPAEAPSQEVEQVAIEEVVEKTEEEDEAKSIEEKIDDKETKDGSRETIVGQHVRDLDTWKEDDANLREDLERLKALQQELAGETDEEVEKFKCRLIEEMPLTESRQEAIKHFHTTGKSDAASSEEEKMKMDSHGKILSGEKVRSGEVSSESQEADEDKRSYDEVFVEAIPGIGGVVPDHLIDAVVEYMKGCAKIQHGIVMPRNIRHYSCPPLEVLDY